jgi:hypothetical protein
MNAALLKNLNEVPSFSPGLAKTRGLPWVRFPNNRFNPEGVASNGYAVGVPVCDPHICEVF